MSLAIYSERAHYSKSYSRMTQDGEPQAKRVKESGDNEEKKLQEEEGNYDSELLEAAKVFFRHFWQIFTPIFFKFFDKFVKITIFFCNF